MLLCECKADPIPVMIHDLINTIFVVWAYFRSVLSFACEHYNEDMGRVIVAMNDHGSFVNRALLKGL